MINVRATQGWHRLEKGVKMGRIISVVVLAVCGTATVPAQSQSPPPAQRPDTISIRSDGESVQARRGNDCGRSNGLLGCDQAFYPGHPTPDSLGLRGGALLKVSTEAGVESVVVRLLSGVSSGGGPAGKVGGDLVAERLKPVGSEWSLRLPELVSPGGGVSVEVRYESGGLATYYARAHLAGVVSIRQRRLVGTHTLSYVSIRSVTGRVVYASGGRRFLGGIERHLPLGRYRLTSYKRACLANCRSLGSVIDRCKVRIRLFPGRLVARLLVRPGRPCVIRS